MPVKHLATFESRNPADTTDTIGAFPLSRASEVEASVASARQAFHAWSRLSLPARGDILYCAAERIDARKEALRDLIVREMGKTLAEATGEVAASRDMARFNAGEGRRLFGSVLPSATIGRHAQLRRVPVGVCALITPWNSPLAALAWKVFPALICGNTCVLKPSEDTPAIAEAFMEILHEAGLPQGVVNLLHGDGETGGLLVRHPGIDLVSFTGSTEVGRDISRACASSAIKVALEMGGKNGLLVMPDADLDAAAKAILSGAFSLGGQRCATTGRVIVDRAIAEALVAKLVAGAAEWKVGPGSDPTTKVCPLVNGAQYERVMGYIEQGKREGARVVFGGRSLKTGAMENGWFVQPTIFIGVRPEMSIAQEEIFGPVLCVMVCDGYDDGIRLMNRSAYGLTASIFTRNLEHAMRFVDDIRAGVCYINAPTFGSEINMPFGGFGASGNGHREAGMGGIDTFSETKVVSFQYLP